MIDLPPLPRGYMLAPVGSSMVGYGQAADTLYTYSGWGEWLRWGNLYGEHWRCNRVFAIPKPRYTCPLEFSRYV